MNQVIINFCIIYALIAACMIARPWMSRKNVLFGVVFGSSEVRKQPEAKRIMGLFVAVCAAIAAGLAIAFCLYSTQASVDEQGLTAAYIFSVLILIALETIPYIWANRSLKKWKETIQNENLIRDQITVELGDEYQRRPIHIAWLLLLLVPVAITVLLTAVYYPVMPDRMPVHYDFSGMADAWEIKSLSLVMAPIIAQVVLTIVLFLVGLFMRNATASVKGSPGAAPGYAAFRRLLSYWLIILGLIVETRFLMTELQYADLVPFAQGLDIALIVLIIAAVLVLIIAFFRMRRDPQGKVYDDDSQWVLGMFYFNPSDPSIFVEKRSGIGQTINFGRPAAWIVFAVIILVIVFAKFIK